MPVRADAYQSFRAFNDKFQHCQRNVRNLLGLQIFKIFLSTPDANTSSSRMPSNRNKPISENPLVTPKRKPEQEALGKRDKPMVPTGWNSSK